MFACCTAIGVTEGHLVYGSGNAPGLHTVRKAGIRLRTWILDLSQFIEHILEQAGSIAGAVAATIV
jgi:5-methylcytosine-specific restriction enzyme subunit McrC